MGYTKPKVIRSDVIKSLKKREKTSVKGDNGKVLVVAGSEDYPGAAVLSATAALAILRSGADYVTVAAPSKVAWVVNTFAPDIVTRKLEGRYFTSSHVLPVLRLAELHDVILIGPGVGRNSGAFIRAVTSRLARLGRKMVIDADAIKAIDLKNVDNAIITPHKGEFEILLKNSRLKRADLRKNMKNNVIILKGPVDEVISKSTTTHNVSGNSVMTKAGTGDVLAGLSAGFYAQSNAPELAASAAAYVNGKTGDYLKKRFGRTFTASDIVANIHKVYK